MEPQPLPESDDDPFSTGVVPAACTWRGDLRAEMIEQVMRAAPSDAEVLAFLDAPPQSRAAMVALGRLLAVASVPLPAGSPLLTWCGGSEPEPDWRSRCPAQPEALWGEYEFMAAMYGNIPAADPYEELERLRTYAERS